MANPMIMAILKSRKPKPEVEAEESDVDPEAGLMTAAEEAMESIQRKDAEALKAALLNFFYIADSMPHKEGGYEDEEM